MSDGAARPAGGAPTLRTVVEEYLSQRDPTCCGNRWRVWARRFRAALSVGETPREPSDDERLIRQLAAHFGFGSPPPGLSGYPVDANEAYAIIRGYVAAFRGVAVPGPQGEERRDTPDGERRAVGETALPRVEYENYGREVWHADDGYPMKHLSDRLTIEDGSVLRLFECTHCAVRAFVGLDAQRYVVVRAAPPTTEGT